MNNAKLLAEHEDYWLNNAKLLAEHEDCWLNNAKLLAEREDYWLNNAKLLAEHEDHWLNNEDHWLNNSYQLNANWIVLDNATQEEVGHLHMHYLLYGNSLYVNGRLNVIDSVLIIAPCNNHLVLKYLRLVVKTINAKLLTEQSTLKLMAKVVCWTSQVYYIASSTML